MQTIPVTIFLDQANAAYVIQSVVSEANQIDAAALSGQIQNSVVLLYSMGGFLAVQSATPMEQRLRVAQNAAPEHMPVSMRLKPSAAAYVVQGVVSEANNINAGMLAPQIQNAIRLLYSMGGMIAVQARSVLEQRLVAAAREAQQAQTATVQVPQTAPVYQPPAPAPVPAPVAPAPAPVAPLQQAAIMTGNPEIAVAGQPVVDITPLG